MVKMTFLQFTKRGALEWRESGGARERNGSLRTSMRIPISTGSVESREGMREERAAGMASVDLRRDRPSGVECDEDRHGTTFRRDV